MFLGKVVHQLFSFSGLALIISNIIVVELVSSSTQFFSLTHENKCGG